MDVSQLLSVWKSLPQDMELMLHNNNAALTTGKKSTKTIWWFIDGFLLVCQKFCFLKWKVMFLTKRHHKTITFPIYGFGMVLIYFFQVNWSFIRSHDIIWMFTTKLFQPATTSCDVTSEAWSFAFLNHS